MAIFKDLIVNGDTEITGKLLSIDNMYPVGAVYISINNTDPSLLFGGTWKQFGNGRLLIGAGSLDSSHTYTGGGLYGSYNIQAHTHAISLISGSTSPTVSECDAMTSDSTSPTIGSSGANTDAKDPGLSAVDPGLAWAYGDENPDQLVFCEGQGDTSAVGIYIGWNGGNRRYKHSGTANDFWGVLTWDMTHSHTYDHYHGINSHSHTLDHQHTMAHNHSFSHSHITTHQHKIAAGTTAAPNGNVGNDGNIEPYVCVYMWERTS